MTNTAEPTMLDVADRSRSARSFFDIAAPSVNTLPPPTVTVPSVPQLPRITPATPSAGVAPAAANPFAFSPASMTPPPSGGPRKQNVNGGGARRLLSRLLMLAVLGGVVFAGVKYGPELMDRAQGDSTNSEPEAPLAFPVVVADPAPPRTANFVVERPAEDGSTKRYEVTNDFETGVSRMLIDRGTSPDVEVLAVFDVANLRVMDQPYWFSMPRGEFPFVGGPERARWVRTIDEYLPASMRSHVSIDRSTESILGTETMRHLVVTVDAAAVATDASTMTVDPVTGQQVPPTPGSPGEFALPESTTGSTGDLAPVTIELWIDANGIVRKLVEPAELGGRTITVVSLTSEAFNPAFPLPESTMPLTAAQLVELTL
jgi:hypothetical protein